uniref:RRM domain-containing protein n=1 Tax=Noctiluca scintillans TaxID=2966 RepID=A0A7S1A065_NOCSC|mmetsp:Transcript_25451/g.66629  ORF Transcript_25451/g.66629 Transcript_25451/m.66629 type:complete len:604 (+) Transcript_25451:69-1880(+)
MPEVDTSLPLGTLLRLAAMGRAGSPTSCSSSKALSGSLPRTSYPSKCMVAGIGPVDIDVESSKTEWRPVSESFCSLQAHLTDLQAEDPNRVLIARKISRMGFRSEEILAKHFSAYGSVKRVLVAHAKVKPRSGARHVRPGSLGFVVMENVEAVERILSAGAEQIVAKCPISVERFKQSPDPSSAQVTADESADKDTDKNLVMLVGSLKRLAHIANETQKSGSLSGLECVETVALSRLTQQYLEDFQQICQQRADSLAQNRGTLQSPQRQNQSQSRSNSMTQNASLAFVQSASVALARSASIVMAQNVATSVATSLAESAAAQNVPFPQMESAQVPSTRLSAPLAVVKEEGHEGERNAVHSSRLPGPTARRSQEVGFSASGDARQPRPTDSFVGSVESPCGLASLRHCDQNCRPHPYRQQEQQAHQEKRAEQDALVSWPNQTLGMYLTELKEEDPRCVLIARRIGKMGFRSHEGLTAHYSRYGEVQRVLVPNSQVKPLRRSGAPRIRPGSLGFVVMSNASAVERILAEGKEQVVAGCRICVEHFEHTARDNKCGTSLDLRADSAMSTSTGGTGSRSGSNGSEGSNKGTGATAESQHEGSDGSSS